MWIKSVSKSASSRLIFYCSFNIHFLVGCPLPSLFFNISCCQLHDVTLFHTEYKICSLWLVLCLLSVAVILQRNQLWCPCVLHSFQREKFQKFLISGPWCLNVSCKYTQGILHLFVFYDRTISLLFSQKEAEDSTEVTSMVLVIRVQDNDRTTCDLAMKLETRLSMCDSHMSHIIRDISMYLLAAQLDGGSSLWITSNWTVFTDRSFSFTQLLHMSVLQFYIMTSNLSVQLTTGVPTSFAATAPENDWHRSSGYLTANWFVGNLQHWIIHNKSPS